jgi:hypothetical protein
MPGYNPAEFMCDVGKAFYSYDMYREELILAVDNEREREREIAEPSRFLAKPVSSETIKVSSNSKLILRCLAYRNDIRLNQALYGMPFHYAYYIGQIEQESKCNPNAVARDGGKGLGQFMDKTWEEVSKKAGFNVSVFNPHYNIKAMMFYNKFNYDIFLNKKLCVDSSYKDLYFVFRAYNGGAGNLLKEIKSCNREEIESNCKRNPVSCRINIEYPYKIFDKASKYGKPAEETL